MANAEQIQANIKQAHFELAEVTKEEQHLEKILGNYQRAAQDTEEKLDRVRSKVLELEGNLKVMFQELQAVSKKSVRVIIPPTFRGK